jgi:uncharacterized integral membrane protein
MSSAEMARPNVTRRRTGPSWVVLLASLCVLALAILLVLSGLLVRLANDHQGHSILPATIGAGSSVTGDLVLSNRGLLPIEVTLQPDFGGGGAPAGMAVTVQRLDDGAFLYQGPMARSMGPLEVLWPGQVTRIRMTVTSTDPHGTAAIPINYTYYWAARPALPWWWWIPTALLILAIVVLGYRRAPRPSSVT